MKKLSIISFALICFLFQACQALEKKQQAGAAVELSGHYLYRSTLDALTMGMSAEDSARVAQQYIEQWAQDVLVYENARAYADEQIEALVEDYRRTLYVHAYEEYLIDRRMPKTIPDSVVEAIYQRMPDRFKLDESIVKGILLVVPVDAPKVEKLRTWLTNQEMDHIEKYAYQNASGYDLFTDKWLTTTDVLSHMPIERADLEAKLKTKNQIEISDGQKIYILQLTDKHLRGEQMPMEYARPEIEKMVLSSRQVEFLQGERERLLEEAIREQKIKFYEN